MAADVIPDEWLLPPENTESEKELAALKAENARLKKAEPYFAIQCLDGAGAEIERYEASFTWFKPLTDAETNALMQHLKERFPLETDFGPRESSELDVPPLGFLIRASGRHLIPAPDEKIAKYRDEAYPQWLERCEEVLSDYHRTLQRQEPMPGFVFLAENSGTRPAADALITIEAQGNFQIKPPAWDEDDEDDSGDKGEHLQKKRTALLPNPPSAPRGSWQTTIGEHAKSLSSIVEALNLSLPGITANSSTTGTRLVLIRPYFTHRIFSSLVIPMRSITSPTVHQCPRTPFVLNAISGVTKTEARGLKVKFIFRRMWTWSRARSSAAFRLGTCQNQCQNRSLFG